MTIIIADKNYNNYLMNNINIINNNNAVIFNPTLVCDNRVLRAPIKHIKINTQHSAAAVAAMNIG